MNARATVSATGSLNLTDLALSINCRPLILQSEAQSLKLESRNILSRKTPNPVLNPEPQSSSLPPQAPKPYNPKPPPPPRPDLPRRHGACDLVGEGRAGEVEEYRRFRLLWGFRVLEGFRVIEGLGFECSVSGIGLVYFFWFCGLGLGHSALLSASALIQVVCIQWNERSRG